MRRTWRFVGLALCVAWLWVVMLWRDRLAERFGYSFWVFVLSVVLTLASLAPFWLLWRARSKDRDQGVG